MEVEKYLFGRVVEAGGKTNTNLHLVLDGSRETVIVAATEQQLQEDERNRLFHEVLVHVSARQNLRTGLLRDVTLLGFADQSAEVDEDALARMVARGTAALARRARSRRPDRGALSRRNPGYVQRERSSRREFPGRLRGRRPAAPRRRRWRSTATAWRSACRCSCPRWWRNSSRGTSR